MGRVRRTTVVLTSVAVTAIAGGGLVSAFNAPAAQAAELPAFDNCSALQHWVDRAVTQEARHPYAVDGGQVLPGGAVDVPPGGPMIAGGPVGTAGPAGGMAGDGTSSGAAAPVPQRMAANAPVSPSDAVGSSATGTNVQEAGVDEPDQVKTNGHYVVGVTAGRRFWVATVTNHSPHVIGRLRLDGDAASLLVSGDRALVLVQPQAYPLGGDAGGVVSSEPHSAPDMAFRPYDGGSRLEIVELSDPSSPHVIAREDVTGSVLTARQVGDVAWVVTQSQPTTRVQPGANGAGLLPRRVIRDGNGIVVASGDALPCTAVRHPITFSGGQLLTVQPVAINAAAPFTHGTSAGVLASASYVYASAQRLYVATNTWDSTATTQLHAFDISNNKSAHYVGSGSVRGTLLSQWAMSEHGGYLRVATTSGDVVPPKGEGIAPDRADQSVTSVTVLAEKGKRLVQVGRVTGLGRGEKVWAVRYLGDIAAVVTFRQTDPLYLVDLSDPTKPQVRGALELTGYSSYLHPVGNGLLLGVGREADSAGHVLNAKATLFDIRDLMHPKRVSNVDLGNGWSEVDGDTHAFTYLPDQHVALLPTNGDGVAATAISVDGTSLHITGHLGNTQYVQRFVPVGSDVIAANESVLYDVDPISLDTFGATRVA